MEVAEVCTFLQRTTPFAQLSDAAIKELASNISVVYYRSHEKVTIDSERLLLVRTGIFTLYSDQQQLLAKLQSQDFYGYQQLLTGLTDNDTLICDEDGLVYWLEAPAFHHCRYQYKNVDIFFQRLFSRRLYQYREQQQSSRFTLKISDIIQQRKIAISPDQSVQQAAKLMSEHRVSSLLVEEDSSLVGIITDRDLRNRVLANGWPASTEVRQAMTVSPHTIDKHAYLYEAVQKMSQFNIHHLPVLDNNICCAMLTATDVIRSQQDHPVYLIGEIHRQQHIEGLERCSAHIASLALTLSKQQVPAHEAGHIITTITDALTQRLIFLAQQQLGPPPCVFSWLAFGSQARMDQSLNADQDNALLLEKEPVGAIADYFNAFASFVCQGLAQCGITLCPGNIMASNPELRLSLKGWSQQFARWINSPTPQALLKASIFFDMRNIYGSKALFNALQQDISQRTPEASLFLMHLAQASTQRTAPLGFFKHFILEQDGKHRKGLDLKKRGISLITDIARVYALAAGILDINTRARLVHLSELGAIDTSDAQNLLGAFDFLAQLRWEKHQHDVQHSHDVTNLLDPGELSGLARHQLKDSFAVITAAQASLKYRFCREV